MEMGNISTTFLRNLGPSFIQVVDEKLSSGNYEVVSEMFARRTYETFLQTADDWSIIVISTKQENGVE